MKLSKRSNCGFGLISLMIVALLMACLALFALQSMSPSNVGASDEAQATEAVEQAREAVDQINQRYQLPEED